MKKERNLLKLLSNEECYGAYKNAFATADVHRVSAQSIAGNGHFGTAVSHLVLGTEELTKGLLLFLQSFSIDVRNVPSIHLFFSDHILKHQFAIYVNTMYPMLKLFMGVVYKMKEELHNPDANIEYTPLEEAFLSKDQKRIQAAFKDMPEMFDWWDEANKMKNKGFYVDYTNSLETPMQVKEHEYLQAISITENFRTQLEEIISYFEKMSAEDRLETAKNAKAFNFSKLLTPIIEARKEQRKNEGKPPKFNFKQ